MRSALMMNLFGVATLLLLVAQSGGAQQPAPENPAGDWPMYRHDKAGTGYSPLTQINTRNVARLTQVWTYRLQSDTPAAPGARGGAAGPNSEATPIVVNRVMYLP